MLVKTYLNLILGVLWLGLSLSAVRAQVVTELSAELAAASSQAEKERKGILLLFTGSDEDPASQRLQERVLSNQKFRMAVARTLVMVEIELPEKKDASPWLQGPLTELVRDLGVNRVPSMHLVDSQIRPFARIDYRGQDAGECLREIMTKGKMLAVRDRHFAVAARMGGLPKARELDLAFVLMGNDICVNRYRDLIDAIFAAEGKQAVVIKRRYAMRLAWEDLAADVPQLLHDGEWQAVQEKVNTFIGEHQGSAVKAWKQQAFYWKATAIMQDEGLMAASDTLEQARDAAPKSTLGKRIARMLKSMEAPAEPGKSFSIR